MLNATIFQFEYQGTEIEKLGGVGSLERMVVTMELSPMKFRNGKKNYMTVKCRHTVTAKGVLARLVGSVLLTVTCKKESPSLASLLSDREFADMPVKQAIFRSEPRLFLWNQEGGNLMIFKVPSNPYQFMIL